MNWFTIGRESANFGDFLDEVSTGSPRATAIVSAAIVEDHLTMVLKARVVQKRINAEKNPVNDMFRGGGPLGDFSNKIDMAYLLACISAEAALELHLVRRIRNAFAHEMETSGFENAKIADLCSHLKRWQEFKITMRPVDDKKQGNVSISIGSSQEEEESGIVFDMLPIGEVGTPRERYVRACQFYVAVFALLIHDSKKPPTPIV